MSKQIREIFERNAGVPPQHKLRAEFALAAFATIKARHVTYVSVPITSGPQLYEFMDRHGFKTQDEAKKDRPLFLSEVIEPNMARGVKGAERWTAGEGTAVIAPAEFDGALYRAWGAGVHWGPHDFMGMWVPLIDEKVTNMAMLKGWQYSNGCGEEYLQAVLMQMGRRPRSDITIVNGDDGRPLALDEGIALMASAFRDILSRGIRPRNMAETLGILIEAEDRFWREQTAGYVAEPAAVSAGAVPKAHAQPSLPPYDHTRVRLLAAELRPMLDQYFPDILASLKTTSSYDFSPLNAIFAQGQAAKPVTTVAAPPAPAVKMAA